MNLKWRKMAFRFIFRFISTKNGCFFCYKYLFLLGKQIWLVDALGDLLARWTAHCMEGVHA